MREGRISWVGPRGYGFVDLHCGQKVFAHANVIGGRKVGHEVLVKVFDGPLGKYAELIQEKTLSSSSSEPELEEPIERT